MERSIDLLATPNWLCSSHRTEILILILHPAAISQHSKNKTIPTVDKREVEALLSPDSTNSPVKDVLIVSNDEDAHFYINAINTLDLYASTSALHLFLFL